MTPIEPYYLILFIFNGKSFVTKNVLFRTQPLNFDVFQFGVTVSDCVIAVTGGKSASLANCFVFSWKKKSIGSLVDVSPMW
jgi:hypothetical protein